MRLRTHSPAGRPLMAVTAAVLLVLGVFAAGQAWMARSRSIERSVKPGSGSTAPIEASACDGTRLRPGDNLQAALSSHPAGASFCFSRGVHRLAVPLTPKPRQRLIAWPGAVLSGARVVTEWERRGAAWRATGQLPASPTTHGECAEGDGCRLAETVFYDDQRLRRVTRRADVGPGRFYADYPGNAIWVGDDPSGHVVEVARAEAAVAGKAEGVLVDGFVIERFANPAQRGAVHALGPGWQIQRNEIRFNHGVGLYSVSARVLGNHVHHNGQLGLGGGGNDQLVEGNEIDHNNTAGFSMLWEAGGAKWARSVGLVVRGNTVHHNQGPGLWTDINNIETLYQDNVVHANASHGIFHEISYRAVIRNNRVTDNGRAQPLAGWGGAGICVAGSPDVEVYGNIVSGNENAIMLVQQVRTDWPSAHGPHQLEDVVVHDNDITMSSKLTGIVDDTGEATVFQRNNRFEGNTYRLSSANGRYFAWQGQQWDRTAWTGRFGQDTTGQFLGLP